MLQIAGPNDMVTTDGPAWKTWRTMFLPGFSTKHITTLVPGMVEDALVLVQKLTEHAERNDVFRLHEYVAKFTLDAIGRAALGIHFNMQGKETGNEGVRAMQQQMELLFSGLLPGFQYYMPYWAWKRWKNSRIMTEYFGNIVDERFATQQLQTDEQELCGRSTLDLALDSRFIGERNVCDGHPSQLDVKTKAGIVTQLRTFIFAGHDTTAATLCYIIHMLSTHPSCLQQLREEHEMILGPVATTASTIKDSPHLINKLEYTLCVIKETLRLYPIGSTVRLGDECLYLHDGETGEKYPTEGRMIMLDQYGMGRSEDVWGPTARNFDPSRFSDKHSSRIPDGAYRAFETGPKNCIGQNFALATMKVVLALTTRSIAFPTALDREALEEVSKDGSNFARDKSLREGKQHVEGHELYQVLVAAAKPREDMPVRVAKVSWST